MHVAELWRFPVKSLAGERLAVAELRPDGILGDRLVQVRNGRDRVVTSRTRPGLLGLRGSLGEYGEPLVNGSPWTSSEAAQAVRAAAGDDARLLRSDGRRRFDVLPLLVATDGAIAALGADGRRLRPNIVIAGVEGLAERTWPGRQLQIGGAIIAVRTLRQRCIMTTFDPDTQEQDVTVLHRINNEFGGRMALDCEIVRGGRLAIADSVELL